MLTSRVPRSRKTSDVRRPDALARALAIDEIDLAATRRERATLVAVLLATRAGRSLGGEVHHGYWKARSDAETAARDGARLELVGMALRDDARAELEHTATGRIRALFDTHGIAIDQLPAGRRPVYSMILGQSGNPERVPLHLPEVAEFGSETQPGPSTSMRPTKGRRPWRSVRGSPRQSPLIVDEATQGWLRIEPRKAWALCIPYQADGQYRPLYPDLVIVRYEGAQLRVDLDPHNPDLADSHHKAKGLAAYARDNGYMFGRMELLARVGSQMRRLDLKDEAARARIFAVDSPAALKALFAGA